MKEIEEREMTNSSPVPELDTTEQLDPQPIPSIV